MILHSTHNINPLKHSRNMSNRVSRHQAFFNRLNAATKVAPTTS